MDKKLAIVFGGSRGIGKATVSALADDGYNVAWTYVSNRPAQDNNERVRAYGADIRNSQEVAQVFSSAQRDFGVAPSCVVVNAGINVPVAPIGEFDAQEFRHLMEVNLFGAFNALSEAARSVADGGSIVAVTTSMVRHAVGGAGPYTASKAAVEALIRSMAKELATRQVRVNAVAPGPVDTDLFNAGKTDDAKKRSAMLSAFNRIGTPSEVAEVIRFLASAQASWVHGQIIQPNGGMV